VNLLAHGVGGRTDLPVPTWMVGYGAAAVLLISFAGLAVFWRNERLEKARPGPLLAKGGSPASRATLAATRAFGLAFFVLLLAAALFGVDRPLENLAPITIYVTFWVGLTIICALVGDLYALLDPYETLASGAGAGATRDDADGGATRFGLWPAAVGLFAFVWLELVYDEGSRPRVLGVGMLLLTAVVLVGAFVLGQRFVREGNPFRAWFGLLGAMAPIGADRRGNVRLRWPLTGLAQLRPLPGTVALVIVALGSTAFDGITRATWWSDLTGDLDGVASTAAATAGLTAAILVVAALYLGSMRIADGLTAGKAGGTMRLADAFVHSLVPIAFAYAVAHYVSLLLFEGQAFWALLSDPFGRGWNVFGTAGNRIDFMVASPRTISWIQVASIVLGHVAGVVLAHDRALALFPGKQSTRSQYPLLVVMVLFTVAGLVLLLGG
jgi:hypothetical protein